MSLSKEAFERATEESDTLSARLIRLFGYDHDAISDHVDKYRDAILKYIKGM